MVRLNEMTLSFNVPCHYLSSILIPYTLVLFELMGIDPWFQRAFLLNSGIREYFCYGRLAVVSDVDDGGFALNVDKELRGSAVL
jgi:hypothetical protein